MDHFAIGDLGEWFGRNKKQVRDDLGDYFEDDASANDRYSGRWFDRYAAKSDPARFQASDFTAIETLGVRVDPETVALLLLEDRAADFNRLLARIPTEVELGSKDALKAIDAGSDARKLHKALIHLYDIKGVKASKLIAAKRPHLIPVIDKKVEDLLQPKKDLFWLTMHHELADPERRKAIEGVCDNAPSHVSLLRRIDVALWMAGGGRHSRTIHRRD